MKTAVASRTEDAEAHRLYLQGRFFAQRANKEDTFKAVELFEQAIARDPNFAAGWAGLSTATWSLAGNGWVPAEQGFERSRIAAKRSVELGPDLAEAHVCLSRIHVVDWNWRGASDELECALALAPGDAQVLRALGRHMAILGRMEESLEYGRRAVDLDPLSYAGHINLAGRYFFTGQLDDAEASIRRGIELNPGGGIAYAALAAICLYRGEFERALEESRQEPNILSRLYAEAMAQHSLGRRGLSDEAIAKLIAAAGDDAAYNVAVVYAWRGDIDLAFEWLERAYAARDVGISNLLLEPFLAPLRSDKRYRALVKRLGLPDSDDFSLSLLARRGPG